MKTVFCAKLDGRFDEIKHNIRKQNSINVIKPQILLEIVLVLETILARQSKSKNKANLRKVTFHQGYLIKLSKLSFPNIEIIKPLPTPIHSS